MEEKTEALSYTDIWSITDEVIEKNKEVKKKKFNIPDTTMTANDVTGFIINEVGNIVAQYGFFVEHEDDERININVSPDGFMAAIYNRPTNIILGYGHPLHFSGLVDPKQASLLRLGPDVANGDNIIISVENDDKLKEQGIVVIMRDTDVMLELLPVDVRENFEESLSHAAKPIEDMNVIEASYNAYMRHIFIILSESASEDNVKVEETEIHE